MRKPLREHSGEGINRRSFVKAAVATGALAASAGALSGCSPRSKDEPSAPAVPEGVLTAASLQQKWAFEIPPEPISDDQVAETIEADVVVVGAGTSGLCTANSATEEGLKVVVVAASAGPVSRGGSNNAIYSRVMERLGLPRTPAEQILKEVFYGSCNMDTKKWYKFYNSSETAMNWAIDLMEAGGYECGIEVTTPTDPNSLWAVPATSHGWLSKEVRATAMGQPFFVQRLAERLVELGGSIYWENIGRQLIRGEKANGTDGRVTGLIAERPDGSFAKYIGTKGVVLATGDFSANRDMMAKYCPDLASAITDDMYDSPTNYDAGFQYGGIYKGEGQQMGLWIGAAWQKVFPNCPMGGTMVPGPGLGYGSHWGLIVDKHGQRFMDEYGVSSATGPIVNLQDGRQAFAIWDKSYAVHTGTTGISLEGPPIGEELPPPTVDEQLAMWDAQVGGDGANMPGGGFVKADTIEEVISQLGLPTSTIETVNRYNEMARNGADTEFYKRPDMLHEIKEGPFYGATNAPGKMVLTVLGGLRTNSDLQVCNDADEPVPGLYNVGTMVGDAFAGNYSFMVCGANLGMNCLTFGYLTGKHIAANE
ncbi:MAG: FAD-dependent oxidoreductase [Bifidobacteriaceae bacterium]|jgi:succinate dehydrogenase/fumarate reductase flavoprotein subunit|nr:FAD-dependent oxidoreductase [Bifidobacteriaceae bacterium]